MSPSDQRYNPTTQAELETLVKQLTHAAHDNHIDVEGGIDVRHPTTDIPDWTVEITRLKNQTVIRSRDFQTSTTRESTECWSLASGDNTLFSDVRRTKKRVRHSSHDHLLEAIE